MLKPNTGTSAASTAAGTILAVASVLLLVFGSASYPPWGIVGLLGLSLGAPTAIVSLAELIFRRAAITLDGGGIHFSFGVLPWQGVESMEIRRLLGQRVLSIVPRDERLLRSWRRGAQRGLAWTSVGGGRDEFNIWERRLTISLDDLIVLMRSYYPVDRLLT